jgi:hypothetical protein
MKMTTAQLVVPACLAAFAAGIVWAQLKLRRS